MKTAEEQARTIWAWWIKKHRRDFGFAGEVANYLNVRDDGLLTDIEDGLRAYAIACVRQDREYVMNALSPAPFTREDIRALPVETP